MEIMRTIILGIGWPVLIVGSVFLIYKAIKFYRDVEKAIWGKLVLVMIIGWLVSMYSLGIVVTFYVFDNLYRGMMVSLPIFLVWFVTMIIITWTMIRWNKEAVTLNAFYRGLEDLVKKRTKELKQAYEIQFNQEKKIRKLHERFVFIAAHELRAPVTAISWGFNIILKDEKFKKSLPKDYLRLFENLSAKNQNLVELVDDLLNIARLQNKDGIIDTKELSFKNVITKVKENVHSLAEKMQVKISWPEANQELPQIMANEASLKEALTNLVVNAIKYNKEEGWVKVETEVSPEEFIVHIKDGGIGMKEEEVAKLFHEFYRVRNRETENIEGTGLGLFISKQLIEGMKGRIWVHSSKDEGSTFSFSIPLFHKKS